MYVEAVETCLFKHLLK